MTDIEQKALALVNEVRSERGYALIDHLYRTRCESEALCRAIEQHEAFRQEVSDIVYAHVEDVMQAADRIEAQAAEIERLQVEAKAQFDRGYYEGCANPIVRHDALREALEAAPLINPWESKEDFGRRQDGWLKTKYRAALEQSK